MIRLLIALFHQQQQQELTAGQRMPDFAWPASSVENRWLVLFGGTTALVWGPGAPRIPSWVDRIIGEWTAPGQLREQC